MPDRSSVLIIQLHPIETPGRISEYLCEKDIPFTIFHSYKEIEFPAPDNFRALITLGCPESVSEFDNSEWSRNLFEYLDVVCQSEIPYLGMCYGAQIMAANRGAAVLPQANKEIGVYQVTLTEDGEDSALFAGFPKTFPVFHWHGDMFDIPVGGEKLAGSEFCANQAYRFKSCWGVQFHLEADPHKLPIWVKEYATELPDVGKTAERVLAEYAEVEKETRRLCYLLLDNFFELSAIN